MSRVLRGVRKRNLDRLLERAAQDAATRGRTAPIPVVTDLDPERFHHDFLTLSRPIVLRGLAKHFPAVGRWSPELFRDAYGDFRVEAVDGKGWKLDKKDTGVADVSVRQMTLGERVTKMLEGGSDYVSFLTELGVRNPELGADIDVVALSRYIRPPRFTPAPIFKFFIGAGGTSTAWDCAELQNLFVQVYGRKEWIMCAPEHTPCLDPRVISLSQQSCHGMVDFRNPDVAGYPLYAHAPLQRVVLEPGDVLYVPPFYWHCVNSPETSIGIAVWWINFLPAIRSHPTLFWLTVLSPQHLLRQVRERMQKKDHRTAVTATSIFRPHP